MRVAAAERRDAAAAERRYYTPVPKSVITGVENIRHSIAHARDARLAREADGEKCVCACVVM